MIYEVSVSMIRITDLAIPELSIYNCRSETTLFRYNEPGPGLFIAESAKVIERALKAGYQAVSCLIEEDIRILPESEYPLVSELISGDSVPVFTAPYQSLEQIAGYHLTGGILCAMQRKEPLPPQSILAGASRVAVLENVTNPTNAGAIVRSAAAMGMDGIIFTGGSADPLYRRAIRVSMGSIFQIPWTVADSANDLFLLLRTSGFVTAALSLRDDSICIDHPVLKKAAALALYLGNEGSGLPAPRIASCDYSVKIPMYHGVDSLNVAAASAVAFWECRKQVRDS